MAQIRRVAKEIRTVRYLSSFIPYLSPSFPGDLIYLNAAGQPVVIINSLKVGVVLLDPYIQTGLVTLLRLT